jgi:hypothetical protein
MQKVVNRNAERDKLNYRFLFDTSSDHSDLFMNEIYCFFFPLCKYYLPFCVLRA